MPVEPPPSLARVGDAVAARMDALLAAEEDRWTAVDSDLAEPIAALRALAAGGKRLRPAFCHWGFVGAGGAADDPRVVDAGAALELLHGFAIVHDDVMDGSARSGSTAAHRPSSPASSASTRAVTASPIRARDGGGSTGTRPGYAGVVPTPGRATPVRWWSAAHVRCSSSHAARARPASAARASKSASSRIAASIVWSQRRPPVS